MQLVHQLLPIIAGYVLPEWFRFPGCEAYESGLGALGSLPAEGATCVLSTSVRVCQGGWSCAAGWFQLIALIGAHEVMVKPREAFISFWRCLLHLVHHTQVV
eukprot:6160619-Amphidinium_carterae.1